MGLLTEEVGEEARIVSRTYGEQSFKETNTAKIWPTNWPMFCLC